MSNSVNRRDMNAWIIEEAMKVIANVELYRRGEYGAPKAWLRRSVDSLEGAHRMAKALLPGDGIDAQGNDVWDAIEAAYQAVLSI